MNNSVKNILVFLFVLIMISLNGYGQINTNKEFLDKFSNRKTKINEERKKKLEKLIKEFGINYEKTYEDGTIGILEDFQNGKPLYNKPLGHPASIALRVDSLKTDGGLNLNMTGAGYEKIGLWESYHPYSHAEYNGRLITGDGGNSKQTFTHSTATAGIITSTGLNSNAIGIANESKLKVFSTVNRLGEMAAEAGNGMELASYSYETRQYYSGTEADIDTIAFAGPNFLLFQAAGNDGSDTPGEVMGQQKNSVTVGAVKIINPPHYFSNEILRGSSSMGPTIDGRIKPDLVAPFYGDDLCNQNQPSGYTSSASPATSWTTAAGAGVGVLLQQYYQDTHNSQILRSSALKGLLVQTAFEAGSSPGPDYEFGWGMINAKKAVNFINYDRFYSDVIEDEILQNGNVYQKQIYSDGSKPIKITICWIDPPAAASGSSDTSPKLINDLDLRIKKDGTTYYPWVLDSESPFNSATKGDNSIDNVEQVLVETPEAGIYTIEVSHKNNLSNDGILTDGNQMFSIITDGNNHCISGSIVLNSDTGKLNFCKNGFWIEKNAN